MKLLQIIMAAGVAVCVPELGRAQIREAQFVLSPDIATMSNVVTVDNIKGCLRKFDKSFKPLVSGSDFGQPTPEHFGVFRGLECARYETFTYFTPASILGIWATHSDRGDVLQSKEFVAHIAAGGKSLVINSKRYGDGHYLATLPDRQSMTNILNAVGASGPAVR